MSEVIRFDSTTRDAILHDLVESARPLRLLVRPDGGAAELSPEVVVRIGYGRVVEARAGTLSGATALARALLARSGSMAVLAEAWPKERAARCAPWESVISDARTRADELLREVEQAGGLDAVLCVDRDALRAERGHLPAEAGPVLAAIDGSRNVGAILAGAPWDELMTASILGRLRALGVLGDVDPPLARKLQWFDEPATDPGGAAGHARTSSLRKEPGWELRHRSAPDPVAFSPERGEIEPHELLADAAGPADLELEAESRSKAPCAEERELDDSIERAALGSRVAPKIAVALVAAAAIAIVVVKLRAPSEVAAAKSSPPIPTVAPPPAPPSAAPDPAPPPSLAPPTPVASSPAVQRAPRRPTNAARLPRVTGKGSDPRVAEAERLLREGLLEPAEQRLAVLRRALPRDAAVWVLSGMLEDERGRPDPAMRYAQQALRVNRKFYRAWVLAGWLEQQRGDSEAAVRSYEEALALEPEHPMSRDLRIVASGLGGEQE